MQDDPAEYWKNFARPEDAVLIFAGDIEPERSAELAKKFFVNWQNPHPKPEIVFPRIPGAGPKHIYLVHQPGSSQAQIRVGQLGITRHDQPEYFISRIVGSYFGGSFNSRLNETIRVEKGLTYGAWGSYIAQNRSGYFVVDTFTKTDSVKETIETIFDLLAELENRPPTEKELTDSKTYISGSFLLQRETPQQIARDLWLVESQDLGDDYFDELYEAIRKTAAEDCVELVEETLHPENMVVVVVGDAGAA